MPSLTRLTRNVVFALVNILPNRIQFFDNITFIFRKEEGIKNFPAVGSMGSVIKKSKMIACLDEQIKITAHCLFNYQHICLNYVHIVQIKGLRMVKNTRKT